MSDEFEDVSIDSLEHIESLLDSVPAFKGRVHIIFSEEDLFDKTKGMIYPIVGLLYGGMTSVGDGWKESGKMGISNELRVTVIILDKRVTTSDPKTNLRILQKLGMIRRKIHKVKAPSGHFWRFQMEGAMESKSGVMVMFQRWSCPVQLVQEE